MRLASLLPMLLLAFSVPVAAQNCQIFDLTATVVQVNPINCQFFISLDFEFNATSNQFTVSGNGNNYGLFTYNQVPLILGPFNGNPNAPTQLEFVVRDAVFPDCVDEVVIVVPPCNNQGICNIENLIVDPGACDPLGLTYSLLINFQASGVANTSTFEVFTGTGISLGVFPLAALPLQIPAFPASGNPIDVIKVCISNQPDCCEILDFAAPPCANGGCNIVDLNVHPGDCTSDSTYKLTFDFEILGGIGADSFVLWTNGQFAGMFGLNQLPLTREVHWNGGNQDEIKVCISNVNIVCCKTIEYHVPACLFGPPCGINDLVIKPNGCPTDSTFKAVLNFTVNDPSAVDSFDLWLNGTYWGQFGMNQLPLAIDSFPWNNLIFSHIKVCTGNDPGCCKELQFLNPACLPYGPCEITNIFLQTGACTSDSTYKILVNFNGTNPGDGLFTISIHNQLIDTFPLTALPLMLEVPWNGQSGDFIQVCILDSTAAPGTQGCCKIKQFTVPACLLPCKIVDVNVDPGDCNPDHTYDLFLDFETLNATNDSFEIWGNGQYLGAFPLSALPLTIPNFPTNGNAVDVLKICLTGSDDCCKTVEFQGPNCNTNCEIFDVVLDPGDCNPVDNVFKLHLNFQVQNPGSDSFEVWGNGQYLGLFALSDLPLALFNFPSNGNAIDVIKICIQNNPDCCKTVEFQGPNCNPPCEIFDLAVDPGDCDTIANTYKLKINFQVQNPGSDSFEVWGNGQYLGVFALNNLPLFLSNMPSNGNAIDVLKVCIKGNPDCCRTIEFHGPNCDAPCAIFDVVVTPGACNPNDDSYSLTVDFEVVNPGNALFEVWGNGQYLGLYPLAGLPIVIQNFPNNGNAIDVIKICINDHPDCCKTIEFQGPNCDLPCEIFNLAIDTGDCHPADSTYEVWVNFQVQNPPSQIFSLWANGQFLGNYNLNQLPLYIPNFEWDGAGPNDVIKVCMVSNNGALGCCRTIEFPTPNCFQNNCDINDLHVEIGDCTSDSTYQLWVNFNVVNPPANTFGLWANGQFFGVFNINALPLPIQFFPWDGGQGDFLKVCFNNTPGGQGSCCAEIDWQVPDCLFSAPCDVFDLTVTPGQCNPNTGTYPLTFDFEVNNPGNDFFEVWVNGVFYGNHLLSTLPFTIPNVPSNGNAADEIKVCINDHPDCCQALTYQGPNCNIAGNCEIFNVVVDPGDCNPATTGYELHLDFDVVNPGSQFFDVWGNNVFIGTFPLANLPIVIPNFPSNGPAVDIIKICIQNDPNCCKTIDFIGTNCGGGLPCDIFDLVVLTDDCTSDSTYQVKIDFQVANQISDLFQVWANGKLIGQFNLNQLPLLIQNFPWDGGATDNIKICMVANVPGLPLCCIDRTFQVPDCLGNDDCHIYDLVVVRTPCLCGQFFVALTFQHENGGSGGFDIIGNGNNYGNFPYDTLQPIILGPFPGDGTTMYEFAVVDHNHPDLCGDDFNLGKVECQSPVVDPGAGNAMLTLSPNPTANWLNVTALLENGASIGQANVEVYAADGRLALSNTVANGANFQLDVTNLPAGMYRLVLKSDSGRLEGTFAKQ